MSPGLSVPLALLAFAVTVIATFSRAGPRKVVLWATVGGTLFLPVFDAKYDLPFIHTKLTFMGVVTLGASLILDRSRWRTLRLEIRDVPVLTLCLVPFASSISNDLGPWDAFASSFASSMLWGAPYLLGRLYFTDPEAVSTLAKGLVKGALIYTPLCLWEIRMSPELHRHVYGFGVNSWEQNFRFEGWRPTVFMQHGLMVGMFMATGTMLAVWLARTGVLKEVWGVPVKWCCVLLAITTVLIKSTGAIVLLVIGLAILEATRRLKTSAFVLALLLVPPLYGFTRTTDTWSGQNLVALARDTVGMERAASLAFRLANEDALADKALKRPLVGWAGWGRAFVTDETGQAITVFDGMWIIYLGSFGLVGLVALGLALALPTLALLQRFPVARWSDPRLTALAALAVATLLWAIDDLLNSMMVPWFPMACGALTSVARWRPQVRVPSRQLETMK